MPTPREGAEINDICAVLYTRGDGRSYHWAFCIPFDTETAHRIHVVDTAPDVWVFLREAMDYTVDVSLTNGIVILVKIGSLDTTGMKVDDVENFIRPLPHVPPSDEPHFTCRTWFKDAIATLDDYGILECPSPRALEKELFRLAAVTELYLHTGNFDICQHFVSAYSK